MEHDISLGFLFKTLKRCWIVMVIVALVAAIIVGVAVSLFIPKKYSSSVEFYVVNTNTSYDYTTSSLLAASEYLINDYVKIIKSDAILELVARRLDENKALEKLNEGKEKKDQVTLETVDEAQLQATIDKFSAEERADVTKLRSMISSSSEESTSLFTIKVTHTDPEYAHKVATVIEDIAPENVTEIAKPDRLTNEYLVNVAWQTMIALEKAYLKDQSDNNSIEINDTVAKNSILERYGNDAEKAVETFLSEAGLDGSLDCFTTVNAPALDTAHDSPNALKYAAVAAVAAAAIVYLVFLIKGIFEMNVSSDDDVKKLVKRPLVGTIPHWENPVKK